MKLWEKARIKYRIGQTGYRKLIFNWFYDWHDEWNEHDFNWRNRELSELLEKGEEIDGSRTEAKRNKGRKKAKIALNF